jgi:hypothetical protein
MGTGGPLNGFRKVSVDEAAIAASVDAPGLRWQPFVKHGHLAAGRTFGLVSYVGGTHRRQKGGTKKSPYLGTRATGRFLLPRYAHDTN